MDPRTFDFEVGVPVGRPVSEAGRVKVSQLPAAKVARTIYRGSYEGLSSAWGEFGDWITSAGYTAADNLWECYITGPESGADPAAWETELNRPLTG
jgi:effector-binding domain-containing protein